jgi:hypothetical protein
MPASIKPGSVKLTYETENAIQEIFNSPINSVKDIFLGPYRTAMAICTVANLYLYPDIPFTGQAPRIQGFCEKAANWLGLNPTFPYITELHTLARPFYWEDINIPGTNHRITLPLPRFPASTIQMLADPSLIEVVLKSHRYSKPYNGGGLSYDSAFNLLRKIFPKTETGPSDDKDLTYLQYALSTLMALWNYASSTQKDTQESDITRNKFLLTCNKEFTIRAHARIHETLKGENLDRSIALEGEKLIDRWKTYASQDEAFDLSKEMRQFTSAVITQACFRDSSSYRELSDAVHFMNEYMFNEATGKLVKGDSEKFGIHCETFRNTINAIISEDEKSKTPLPLFKGLDLAEKQGLCFLMFFAGQETTAFALAHNFATLTLNPEKHKNVLDKIKQSQSAGIKPIEIEELNNFINTQLLEVPPAGAVARRLMANIQISFETSDGKKMGKRMRRLVDGLTPHFAKTAKKLLDKAAENLLENKNEPAPTYSDASVFGEGANRCIGQALAIKELFQLPALILPQFEITTTETEFKYVAKVTNQAKPFPIKVKSKT